MLTIFFQIICLLSEEAAYLWYRSWIEGPNLSHNSIAYLGNDVDKSYSKYETVVSFVYETSSVSIRVIMRIKRDHVHDSKEVLNKQGALYSKIILILSLIHCLASSINSRRSKIEPLVERANNRLMWLPSRATSYSLTTVCTVLLNLGTGSTVADDLLRWTRDILQLQLTCGYVSKLELPNKHHQPPLLCCIALSVHSSIQ